MRARPRPRAAARAGAGAVRDHALRVARSAWCSSPAAAARRSCVRIFQRWDLEVADDRRASPTPAAPRCASHGETVADIPIAPLTDEAPVYHRPVASRPRPRAAPAAARRCRRSTTSPGALRAPARHPRARQQGVDLRASTTTTVRTNTVIGPGGDAAVLRLKGTPLGHRPHLRRQPGLLLRSTRAPAACRRWPRRRATSPASAPSRSGSPTASTSATPRTPRSPGSSARRSRGMAEACRALEVPVVSGNVSLYNETEGSSIHPTPTIAMVGVMPDLARAAGVAGSPTPATASCCSARTAREFGGSAYLRLLHGIEQGRPPAVDLDAEARLAELLRLLALRGLAAHRARRLRGRPRGGARRGHASRAAWAPSCELPTATRSRCSPRPRRAR